MTAGIRAALLLAATLVLAAAIGGSTAAASGRSEAVAKGTCSLTTDEAEHLGTSYVYPLKVKHTSCGKGKKVVKAFNKCRKAHGGRDGRCKSKVLGYKCDEGKRTTAPSQYSAHVECKNGAKKVIFDYTQNT